MRAWERPAPGRPPLGPDAAASSLWVRSGGRSASPMHHVPRRAKPVPAAILQGPHSRGTTHFVERYGASVWAPTRAAWRKRPNPATTDELPRGVEAIELDGEPQQVVFFIHEHATLVSGDVLSGTGGKLHVFVDEADPVRLLPALDALADLAIERVIIPHGDLILSDGAARI